MINNFTTLPPCTATHHTAVTLTRWAVWRAAHPEWVYVPRTLMACAKLTALGAVLAVGPAAAPALFAPVPVVDMAGDSYGQGLGLIGGGDGFGQGYGGGAGYGQGYGIGAGAGQGAGQGGYGAGRGRYDQSDAPGRHAGHGDDVAPVPVPEPASIALMGCALLALAVARSWKRRVVAQR